MTTNICKMTTETKDTRVRSDHSTLAAQVRLLAANVTIEGSEIFTAAAELKNASGAVYQMPGDKWVKIAEGWVAYIHMGEEICKDFEMLDGTTPTPPPAGQYAVTFVVSDFGMIDAIKIMGPEDRRINILYNDEVIAGI